MMNRQCKTPSAPRLSGIESLLPWFLTTVLTQRYRISGIFLAASLVAVFTSCHDNGVEPTEGGPGIIVPGKSVEGIKLGDTRETVEAQLGRPTSVGWADGLYRGWRHYSYSEGTRDSLSERLAFYFLDYGDSYGPIDWISMGQAYSGKTRGGIGIGSAIEQVRRIYGPPVETFLSQGIIVDKYCENGKKLEIHYRDSLVSVMSIGYFLPMPQDNPCQ